MSKHALAPSTTPPQSEKVLDPPEASRAGELPTAPLPDRRRTPRGIPGFEPNRAQLISTTLGSYYEMPGLTLFVHQAARLFGISIPTCQLVLDDLVKDRRLGRDARGQYVR